LDHTRLRCIAALLGPFRPHSEARHGPGRAVTLVAPDPSSTEVNTIWGIAVLDTMQLTAGLGVLVDSTKFGRVHVREPIGVRVGFANDDFSRDIVRYVAEERIALAVERPSAVCEITDLPTS
jgi:hypothetical protein